MDTGTRYTPKSQGSDWENSIQFLPAANTKKLEKKKGLCSPKVLIGVVVLAAVLSLITGLLIWHFHFRKEVKIKKIYTGSMRITNQVFLSAYEDPNSAEFKSLSRQVVTQLKSIYSIQPLSKYYVDSTVQGFSEGSVIAYYQSDFNVPKDQVAALDLAMSSLEQKTTGKEITRRISNSLVYDSVVSAAVDSRMMSTSKSTQRYTLHAVGDDTSSFQSPGFPNSPYPSNTLVQWQLRAKQGYVIRLEFDSFDLEPDCNFDFVKIYDSLVAIERRVMVEMCGYYEPNVPLSFISSGNVMLVTLVTNEKKNYPGFRARFKQIPLSSKDLVCGGVLMGDKGNFTSPNYPSYYPPNKACKWNIQVPAGKSALVKFITFQMPEPGLDGSGPCTKDYVDVNGVKVCGTKPSSTVFTNDNNQITVRFSSDTSYVSRGFSAGFEAVETTKLHQEKFQCGNERFVQFALRCDGWNDCGDNTDEQNCECTSSQIKCNNGMCKPMFWQCDGVDDCGDNTDEQSCGCKPGDFKCRNGVCVSEKMRCDGKDDCGDGSDELNCKNTAVTSCTASSYKCKSDKCISKPNPECDGVKDCDDGSDEADCDCGKRMTKTQRIVGGQNAEVGEWPWQVSLHIKNVGHVCGASIINNRWLVTAAHCVQDDAKTRYSQPSVWEAFLGLHSQKDINSDVVKRNLKSVIQHPNYNEYTYDNDIALMELDSPVAYSSVIKPICLPAASHDFPAGKSVTITGWGATREGGFGATVLQKAEVRIINSTVCNQLMGGQITSRMMCAGVLTGGVDACQGDSGGPLSSMADIGNHMFLAGVVSWGDGCARRDKPGIYTRVTQFRGWIREKTGV